MFNLKDVDMSKTNANQLVTSTITLTVRTVGGNLGHADVGNKAPVVTWGSRDLMKADIFS